MYGVMLPPEAGNVCTMLRDTFLLLKGSTWLLFTPKRGAQGPKKVPLPPGNGTQSIHLMSRRPFANSVNQSQRIKTRPMLLQRCPSRGDELRASPDVLLYGEPSRLQRAS
jgi:hypothetical protein